MTDHTSNREAPWLWRGIALAVLGVGWLFIAWTNHFRFSAPVVFVCLGFFAIVATVYNLWRTGAVAVSDEDIGDSTWARPEGALSELEREKRKLLKAIKDAEFDHQMGKLSQRDHDEMVGIYRARAIEVFKEIDRLSSGNENGVRQQILREVRARLEVDAQSAKKKADKKAKGKKGEEAKAERSAKGEVQDNATAKGDAKAEAAKAEAAEGEAAKAEAAEGEAVKGEAVKGEAAEGEAAKAEAAEAASAAKKIATPAAEAEAHEAAKAAEAKTDDAKAAAPASNDDNKDAARMDAVVPARDAAAKEATP